MWKILERLQTVGRGGRGASPCLQNFPKPPSFLAQPGRSLLFMEKAGTKRRRLGRMALAPSAGGPRAGGACRFARCLQGCCSPAFGRAQAVCPEGVGCWPLHLTHNSAPLIPCPQFLRVLLVRRLTPLNHTPLRGGGPPVSFGVAWQCGPDTRCCAQVH